MKRHFKCFVTVVFAVIVLMPVISACGKIKEDRKPCPLYVFFNDDINPYDCRIAASVRIIRGNFMSMAGVFPMEDFEKKLFSVETERGENTCSVVCGGIVSGHEVVYRNGEPVGDVYALAESFCCGMEDEEYTVQSQLCSQTASVKFALLNTGIDAYPVSLRICSRWAGFDILTLEPVSGEYNIDVENSPHISGLALPRQGDDTLILEFLRRGTVVGQYALGEAIIRSGYDWTAEHLEPITVEVNFSLSGARITVNDWKEQILIDYKV